MTFKVGDVVVMSTRPGHVYMIGAIIPPVDHQGAMMVPSGMIDPDMNRYDCQEDGPDGDLYYSMPGYLMRKATEDEIEPHRRKYDIVERLLGFKRPDDVEIKVLKDAASEIERLRADLKSRRENWGGYSVDEVKRIVADEREACARVADAYADRHDQIAELCGREIAALIRGRKDD